MGGRACNDEFCIQPAGRMIAFPLILPAAPFAIGEAERLAAKLERRILLESLRLAASRTFGVPAQLFQPRGLWYEGRVDRRKNFSRRSQKEKQ